MRARLLVGVVLGVAAAAQFASAQIVRGRVTAPTGLPVPGVLVELLDRDARPVARGVSDERGAFRLGSTSAGVYRVQARRIGFRPTLSDTVSLVAGGEVQRSIVLREISVALDTIRVGGRSACRGVSDSATSTFRVWEQVRTALSVLEATEASKNILATVGTYQRVRAAEPSRDRQSVHVRSDYVRQPWRTIPPDSLHRAGYVITSGFRGTRYSTSFYAPGLDMLLSPFFVQDHCFRVIRDKERLGLGFQPSADRRHVPEIRGTLWLDLASSELRRVEFQYANVRPLEEDEGRGFIDVRRLKDGSWAITSWNIRMPLVEQIVRPGVGAEERVAEITEVGGWLALARRGADTLWAQQPVSVSLSVVDSASNTPMQGVRAAVVGTSLRATSDRDGLATIAGILPGEYTVELSMPTQESSTRRISIAVTGEQDPIRVRIPRAGDVTGRIVGSESQQPVEGAEIQLPALGKRVLSNADGTFRLGSVPTGAHRLTVRHIGFTQVDTTISTTSQGALRIPMSRVTKLDSVVVVDHAVALRMRSFEENRRAGLGHFMTREILARLGETKLTVALEQLTGLRLLRGPTNQAWVVSGGAVQSIGGRSLRIPGDPGAPRACYSQVYVDGALAYGGRDNEPLFDVNRLNASDVEAIEFYAGPAQTPLRYSNDGSSCGVVVIWRR